MTDKMKILIAYDGSECGEAALEDLRRAGLPAEADVLVISVADVFLPPQMDEGADDTFPAYVHDSVREAHERATKAVEKARAMAERACVRVRKYFPGWTTRAEAYADSPAWGVIRAADEWKPELAIVGAHGHTLLGGRLILGSVSQRVLYESRCSVRIARSPVHASDWPIRLIVASDASPDSEAAIDAVAARSWPADTEVRVVSVLDTFMPVTPDPSQPLVVEWVEVGDEDEWGWIHEKFEHSVEKLRNAGLNASLVLRKGKPKRLLVEEAEEWESDSIFLGAKGMRGVDRLLLGSVSAAVAARAPCSVEIVRRPENTTLK